MDISEDLRRLERIRENLVGGKGGGIRFGESMGGVYEYTCRDNLPTPHFWPAMLLEVNFGSPSNETNRLTSI